MIHHLAARVCHILAAAFLTLSALPAVATTIPGSSGTALPEATELATGITVRSIKDQVRSLRDAQGVVLLGVSSMGQSQALPLGGGVPPLGFGLQLRDLDTARLDGRLMTGNLLLAHSVNDRMTVFGGLLVERLGVDTAFNNGRIDSNGWGIALGADYRVSDALYLTGIVGGMKLDYDVSRDGGAFSGNFTAQRQFVDLSGDYMIRAGGAELTFGAGLLYVRQHNAAYTESGGVAVAAFTSEQLSGTVSARSLWGQAEGLQPFVDAHAAFRLAGNTGLAGALDPGDDSNWTGRLGVGVLRSNASSGLEAGIGANFGDGGFQGIDLSLNYTYRF